MAKKKKKKAPQGTKAVRSQGLVAREDLTADFPMGEKRFEAKPRKLSDFVGPDSGPTRAA